MSHTKSNTTGAGLPAWSVRSRGFALLMAIGIGMCCPQEILRAQGNAKNEGKPGAEKAEAVARAEASGGVVDPHAYKIGAEDVLSIKVWREADLSGQFTVRPDGKITLPLSGEVMAGGLTPAELQKVVTEAYGKLVKDPDVMLQVEMVRSKKYFLVGEVNKTGAFPLVVPTTVLDAINSAGGLREFANAKSIIILRGATRIKFNYKEVIQGKKLEQNVFLENGDHVIVR